MTTDRASVKAWLVATLTPRIDALATEDQPVAVDDGWPGKNLERNHVWADRATGSWAFEFLMAGTKQLEDKFTLTFVFQAAGPADSIAECDARAESYAREFALMVAEDPSLNNMTGLVAAFFDDDAIEGPNGQFTDEGAVSFVTAQLKVHIRTT